MGSVDVGHSFSAENCARKGKKGQAASWQLLGGKQVKSILEEFYTNILALEKIRAPYCVFFSILFPTQITNALLI